jgi:D-glycero-D-manno-heptose 1,7-bisphosphate phosphatase
MNKCVFFDRDGIVNKAPVEGGYVERLEDFEILPEFVSVLKAVSAEGYLAAVVTNQRCVSRGIVSLDVVDSMHDHLRRVLEDEYGITLLDIMLCPHGRDDGCDCRKPKPGMLLTVAQQHDIDLDSSWMIGDHETDIEAGTKAGCRTIRVLYGDSVSSADFAVVSMVDLQEQISGILETDGGRGKRDA